MHNQPIGAPDLEEAYYEAARHAHPQTWEMDWSHPAVKHAYLRTGNVAFLNDTPEKVFKKFEANYNQACLDYAAGKIIERKNGIVRDDRDPPVIVEDTEHWRPGRVLKRYENVKTRDEAIELINGLLGNSGGVMKNLIDNIGKGASQD